MKDERWWNPKQRSLRQAFILRPSALILCLFALASPALAGQLTINTATQAELTTLPSSKIRLLTDSDYYQVLVEHIQKASRRIDLAMYFFKVTGSSRNKPAQLVRELAKAQRRGVKVQVILEKSGYNESLNKENERTAQALREKGITVRFDSAAITTHAKVMVIDQRFCFIGSHNFTHSALTYNHELSLLVDDTHLARQLLQHLNEVEND